jgi:hypothetical protein
VALGIANIAKIAKIANIEKPLSAHILRIGKDSHFECWQSWR